MVEAVVEQEVACTLITLEQTPEPQILAQMPAQMPAQMLAQMPAQSAKLSQLAKLS